MSILKNLTVAILTYRRPKQLKSCLDSLNNQQHYPLKVFIIDNNFHQEIKDLCQKYKNILPTYLFINETNISMGRNLAINKCRTKYLAFIDDDCVLTENWSKIVKKQIDLFSKNVAVLQGQSLIKEKNPNYISKNIFYLYKKWITQNIYAVDTKNIILNITLIKKHRLFFDKNLPIFEDVDFGLKLAKKGLVIKKIPQLLVYHPELSKIILALKKFYYRGRIKYLLNQKWGNYDNFIPLDNFFKIIHYLNNHQFNIIQTLFEIVFGLGYIKQKQINTIWLVNVFDKSANQERLEAVSKFLKKNKYQVNIVDSQLLFNKYINNFRYCFISPFFFFYYRLIRFIVFRFKKYFLKNRLFYIELVIRGRLIDNYLKKNKAKIVISQNSLDLGIAQSRKNYYLILDEPTVFSEEIILQNIYPKNIINLIIDLERKAYQRSNYICFHWYSFLKIAINKYPDQKDKFFILNWGCVNNSINNNYSSFPKIIYLGKLNTSWVNPQLLDYLQRSSIFPIDIFSYEKPDFDIYQNRIKYNGYLKKLSDMIKYQFGLITLSNDQLRNRGFSAKHLLYLSFGLPVLCPDSRRDPLLESATIYYNSKTFNHQIKKYSQKKYWLIKHRAALEISKKLNWNITLKPLLEIIQKSNEFFTKN